MSKILAVKGDRERGNEVIALLEMLGGDNRWKASGNIEKVYYSISNGAILYSPQIEKGTVIYTLDEFYKNFPFKVGDKIFLYDNITEGCVTGMEWDENKGTVKYCVYTSAEYWCDVKELLKWNAEFLVNKEKNEEVDKMLHDTTLSHLHRNHLEVVLSELYEHIKTTPKEELEREFEEIKEWSNVGPTVEEFMTFCECVNKKPKYPDNYDECVRIAKNIHGYDIHIDAPAYMTLMESFVKLLICRDAYWKIAGEELGLGKPWEPDWGSFSEGTYPTITKCNGKIVKTSIYTHDCPLAFPTEEMRNVFHDNFKDLIEQCKEML